MKAWQLNGSENASVNFHTFTVFHDKRPDECYLLECSKIKFAKITGQWNSAQDFLVHLQKYDKAKPLWQDGIFQG